MFNPFKDSEEGDQQNTEMRNASHSHRHLPLSFSSTWPSTHLDRVESARPTHSHLYSPGRENTLHYVLSLITSTHTQTLLLTGTWLLTQPSAWQHTIQGHLSRKSDRHAQVEKEHQEIVTNTHCVSFTFSRRLTDWTRKKSQTHTNKHICGLHSYRTLALSHTQLEGWLNKCIGVVKALSLQKVQ